LRVTARVPATVANLGPGFDSFGLALSLYNEIEVDTDAEPGVLIEGEGADELPRDGSNLVVRAMQAFAIDVGRELPPLSIKCTNAIPLERGLGSSAAAAVGGLLLADRLLGVAVDRTELLRLATALEGHADNSAAALSGGLAVAYLTDDGWRAERVDPTSSLRPVVLISELERVGTEAARRSLPDDVALEDASFNASRAGLLILALTVRPELLGAAVEDRLHQEARLGLAPAAAELFERLRHAGVPVCVAGSGPTLLAFESDQAPVPDPGQGWRLLRVEVAPEGAALLEHHHPGR
jgi:homoserine kinase